MRVRARLEAASNEIARTHRRRRPHIRPWRIKSSYRLSARILDHARSDTVQLIGLTRCCSAAQSGQRDTGSNIDHATALSHAQKQRSPKWPTPPPAPIHSPSLSPGPTPTNPQPPTTTPHILLHLPRIRVGALGIVLFASGRASCRSVPTCSGCRPPEGMPGDCSVLCAPCAPCVENRSSLSPWASGENGQKGDRCTARAAPSRNGADLP